MLLFIVFCHILRCFVVKFCMRRKNYKYICIRYENFHGQHLCCSVATCHWDGGSTGVRLQHFWPPLSHHNNSHPLPGKPMVIRLYFCTSQVPQPTYFWNWNQWTWLHYTNMVYETVIWVWCRQGSTSNLIRSKYILILTWRWKYYWKAENL